MVVLLYAVKLTESCCFTLKIYTRVLYSGGGGGGGVGGGGVARSVYAICAVYVCDDRGVNHKG